MCDRRVCHSNTDGLPTTTSKFESLSDETEMAPVTGVKRKRLEVDSGDFSLPPLNSVVNSCKPRQTDRQ